MEESGSAMPATPFMDTVGTSSPTPETALFNSFDDYSSGPGTDSGLADSATESSYSIWSVISFILIILIVWVLIFNFFNLGKITDWIESFLKFVGYSTSETVKTTANVGATGITASTNAAAGTLTGGIDMLEKGLSLTPEEKARAQSQQQAEVTALYPPPLNPTDVQKTEESAVLSKGLANLKKMTPLPDDATSVTQGAGRSKSGYCYIGEDRGFRSCIKVGENDQCMSGDIFPTMDICINPNLRA
jgi:hypothetical protein